MLLFAFILYLIFLNKTYVSFIKSDNEKPVDNVFRNEYSSTGFVAEADGKLYVARNNQLFKTGIYELSPPFSHCVLWEGFLTFGTKSLGYVYNNHLLESNLTYHDDGTITIDDLISGEPVIQVKNPNYNPNWYYIIDNEIYFFSDSANTLYHYTDEKLEPILSEEICGSDYVRCDFYKGCVYYSKQSEDVKYVDDYSYPLKLYQVDLSQKKLIKVIDLSGMKEIYQQHKYSYCKFFVCDNYIYYEFSGENKSYYFQYDLNTKKAKKMYETGGVTSFNAYGDNAYVTVYTSKGNKSGLYVLNGKTEQTKKLVSGEFDEISIIDEKWVYLTSFGGGEIYRITVDGSTFERVI